MKKLKPFKEGATYKLRKECELLFFASVAGSMMEGKMTIQELINDGFTVACTLNGSAVCDGVFIVTKGERHMFYRVDNKK